jgi:hypothetical protein
LTHPPSKSTAEVEEAWRLQWLMEALTSTGRNKRCDVVALVVDRTCGSGKVNVSNDGCKSFRDPQQRDLYLHGNAVRRGERHVPWISCRQS